MTVMLIRLALALCAVSAVLIIWIIEEGLRLKLPHAREKSCQLLRFAALQLLYLHRLLVAHGGPDRRDIFPSWGMWSNRSL